MYTLQEVILYIVLIVLITCFIILLIRNDSKNTPHQGDPFGIVGLTEQEAINKLKMKGYTMRVIEIDGTPLAMTLDYRLNRVNVGIENGTVSKFFKIG